MTEEKPPEDPQARYNEPAEEKPAEPVEGQTELPETPATVVTDDDGETDPEPAKVPF